MRAFRRELGEGRSDGVSDEYVFAVKELTRAKLQSRHADLSTVSKVVAESDR